MDRSAVYTRGVSLRHDLRFSLNALFRRPTLALAAVATLGLGIGAGTAIFSFVHALLLRSMPFPDADRLVAIEVYKSGQQGRISQREVESLRRDTAAFETVASYYTSQYALVGDGDPQELVASINSHDLFETLGLELAAGEGMPSDLDYRRQFNVVLGYGLWRDRFGGDDSIVGRSVTLDGAPYRVVGVAPAGLDFPNRVQLFRQTSDFNGLDGRRHRVVARLASGASLREASVELGRLSRQWEHDFPGTNASLHFEVTPLRDQYISSARPYLLLLAGAVVLVFATACFNVVNLLLNRAVERRRELSVRVALGAGRLRLLHQSLLESLLLSLAGGAMGIAIAALCLRGLVELARLDLPAWMRVELDGAALLFALGVSIVSGLAVGVAPAFVATGVNPMEGLKSASRGGSAGPRLQRVRRGLVVGELALASLLLVAAGLMVRSAIHLERYDPGFSAANLLTFRVDPPWSRYSSIEQTTPFFHRSLEALRALPGVTAAAATHNLPLADTDENAKRVITVQGQTPDEQEANPFARLQSVSDGYFEAMGVPLREGRAIEATDALDQRPVAVVSASLAKALWPGESPLRRRLRLGPLDAPVEPDPSDPAASGWLAVVGVAEDVHSEQITGPVASDLYVSNRQFFTGDSFFVLRTTQGPSSLVLAAEQAIQRFDPDLPLFDVALMEQRVADSEWQRRVAGALFLAFGLASVLLAAIGVYGVTAHSVRLRYRELGICMALGASPARVLRMVLQEGQQLCIPGAALGLVVAAALAMRARDLLFGVDPIDLAVFGGAAALLITVVVLACFGPAWRAARVQPLEALREE